MLDNFPHIKAFWMMLGPKLSQISLCFGVDDVDGTVMEERITHMAGAQTPQGLTRAQLQALIREAGCEPVERDTLYRVGRISVSVRWTLSSRPGYGKADDAWPSRGARRLDPTRRRHCGTWTS